MARMLPPTVHSSIRSGAERRLFNMVRRAADLDEWTCLHSLALARHEWKRRAELDFVFLSRRGIVVLEVKGGRIGRDEGVWVYTDRYGERHHRVESPFDQASSGMFALEKSLSDAFDHQFAKSLLLGYAVAFPDVRFDVRGTECDSAIVYDRSDRDKPFSRFLDRVLEFSRSRRQTPSRQVSAQRLDEIITFLRGDFDLCPTFRSFATDIRDELDRLTTEQLEVLDAASVAPRLIVEGPAGSGKTILAQEEARRAARRGGRVLFLCFNRFLAVRVREHLRGEPYSGTIAVRTIHKHCFRLIQASSLLAEFSSTTGSCSNEAEVYEEWLPLYGRMAADEDVEAPFDTVVVDEAQDVLKLNYFEVVSASMARGFDHGSWRLFLDENNQSGVFGRLDQSCLQAIREHARSLLLTSNCRNTREIAFQVNALTAPRMRTVGRVSGVPVEYHFYCDRQQFAGKLQGVIEALRREDVPLGCQTVLLPRSPTDELQQKLESWGIRPMRDSEVSRLGDSLDYSTWSTVSAFKGLENDVIVLAGVDQLESDWWDAVTYVGMSRARARLIVVLAEECRLIQRERLTREATRLISTGEAKS